jgi:hypothetical protein
MKDKHNFLSFKVYEYETFKYLIAWLIENCIVFDLKVRGNVVGILTYKFKIELNKIATKKKNLLIAYITKEEIYRIRFS